VRTFVGRIELFTARTERSVSAAIERINQALDKSPMRRGGLDFRREGDRFSLAFELADVPAAQDAFFHELRGMKEVVEIRSQ
jgi:hypothetical protein